MITVETGAPVTLTTLAQDIICVVKARGNNPNDWIVTRVGTVTSTDLGNMSLYRFTANSNESGLDETAWTAGVAYGGIASSLDDGAINPWIPWTGELVPIAFSAWISDTSGTAGNTDLFLEEITNPCTTSSTVTTTDVGNLVAAICNNITFTYTPTSNTSNTIFRFRVGAGQGNKYSMHFLRSQTD